MAVNIGPVLSLIAQRIVAAPPSIDLPGPTGAGTVVKRYREGLILEAQARGELAALGYPPPRIDQEILRARLEREYDDYADRLAILREALAKGSITLEELTVRLLALVPDPAKAQLLLDLEELRLRPKPRVLTPDVPPTLTVAKLIAAWKAGVLARAALAGELAARGYSPVDVEILIRTEEARLPKPQPAALKSVSLGDLRAMLALGVIDQAELRAELLERNYPPEDADRLLNLELARQATRLAPPTPAQVRQLPLGDLRAMYTLDIIDQAEIRAELAERNYSAEDIDREIALLQARQAPAPIPVPPG